nr:outer membrane beta-barrel protein [Pseudomonas sp. ANT_J28]
MSSWRATRKTITSTTYKHPPHGSRPTGTSTARGDFNALTVGFRWDVSKNVSLRPELRYDWFEPLDHDRIYGNGRDRTQITGLVEALVYSDPSIVRRRSSAPCPPMPARAENCHE